MPIPAALAVAGEAYGAYQAIKQGADTLDSAGKLVKAAERASRVLDQVKSAVHAFDGGISSREDAGNKGMEIDMPKLAGLFPTTPGEP